jgi:hypothetical protein
MKFFSLSVNSDSTRSQHMVVSHHLEMRSSVANSLHAHVSERSLIQQACVKKSTDQSQREKRGREDAGNPWAVMRFMSDSGRDCLLNGARTSYEAVRAFVEKLGASVAVRKAGIEPCPKTFQNCRQSRQTELKDSFP